MVNFPKVSWQEFVDNTRELNDTLKTAAKNGGFYLEMSPECKEQAIKALALCEMFPTVFKDLKFKGTREGVYPIEGHQYETFMLFKKNWDHLGDCKPFAEESHKTAVKVLKKTLEIFGFKEDEYDLATKGATGNEGQIRLNLQNYDPTKTGKGLMKHTDAGFLTLVYAFMGKELAPEGLQAEIEGKMVPVKPLEGHFFVNYGNTLKILINDPKQLIDIPHEVTNVEKMRRSFALFLEPNHNGLLRQRDNNTGELGFWHESFPELLSRKAQEMGYINTKSSK